MTVQSQTSRVSYAGAGTTGPFPVPFYFLENSHLQVIKRSSTGVETTLTLSTDYTVTGAGEEAGGSVTTIANVAVGETLVILRNIPLTQLVDYVRNDPFPETTHELALDKLTMIAQQLSERLARALVIPPTDDSSDLDELIAGVLVLKGIVEEITTVAGISTEIQAVYADAEDIGTVAGNIGSVNTVAARDEDIGTVAARDADIGTVADRDSDIGTLASIAGAIQILAALNAQIVALADRETELIALGARTAEIDALYAQLSTIAEKVNKSGDTMTGPLVLAGNPTEDMEAATKQYVDLAVGGGGAPGQVEFSANIEIDLASNTAFEFTLEGDASLTFSNPQAGTTRLLWVSQDEVGGHSLVINGILPPAPEIVPFQNSTTALRLDVYAADAISIQRISYLTGRPIGRHFDGESALMLGPQNVVGMLRGATELTIFARARSEVTPEANRNVISLSIGSVAALSVGVGPGGFVKAGARSQSGDDFQQLFSSMRMGTEWRSLLGIYDIDSDAIAAGMDGEIASETSCTFGATSLIPDASFPAPGAIGAVHNLGSQFWKGDIADVAIWRRKLTQDEFRMLHEGLRPDELPGIPPVAYWPLDDVNPVGYALNRIGGPIGVPYQAIGPAPVPLPAPFPEPHASDALAPELRFQGTRVMRLSGAAASVGRDDGDGIASVVLEHAGVAALQGTIGNRPDYKLLSGKHAIRFTAANSEHLQASVGDMDTRHGITVVALMDSRAAGRVVSISDLTTAENNGFVFTSTNGLFLATATAALPRATYTDYTDGSTGLGLFAGRWSGAELVNWLNGVKRNGTVTSGTENSDGSLRPNDLPNSQAVQLLQFGRRLHSTTNLYWDGDLYDMIIVEGAVTDEEVRFLEGVIAWENGSTNLLPSGHPWKNTQPTFTSPIDYIWGSEAGSVIARSARPKTEALSSPSLMRGSDGLLYCLFDTFRGGSDLETTRLLVSADDGVTWQGRTRIDPLFWPTIWEHIDGNLYILGTDAQYGNVILGKSIDRGFSWEWVTLSAGTGPLAAAGSGTTPPNYHRAGGLPPLYHDGHLFFAVENLDPFDWGAGFRSFVLYVPESADLMDPATWSATSQLVVGALPFTDPDFGLLEGSAVVDGTGQLWLIYRGSSATTNDNNNKGGFIPVGWDGSDATMPAWSSSFVKDLPGGNVKVPVFEYGGYFYIIANQDVGTLDGQRNRSVLLRSSTADLSDPNFAVHQVLIDEGDVESATGMSAADSVAYHGFQYPSFIIEDGTIHVVYRLAWSGAEDFHDSNLIGYGRFSLAP